MILAPDGHHVTWQEFNTVEGSISVKCLETGTYAVLHLSGLIPTGLYTIWNVTFEPPEFDPNVEDMNLIGLGAFDLADGNRNTFRASKHGRGSVAAITPKGNLSMQGEIGGCALTDEFEWHVVGVYHLDDQAHGPNLGPDGTAVEQFGFVFTNESE